MAAPTTGMEKSEMKVLLKKASPDRPVSFALAQGKEGGLALLKMDKLKNPKACEKMLAEEFKDAKNLRFGTVSVSEDNIVRFKLNKAVSGMAPRLVKTLKGTGFKAVALLLEDGTSVENAADEEGASEEDEAEAEGPDAAPPAPEPEAAPADEVARGADPAELAKSLAELMKQIPAAIAANPVAKDVLVKLATAANAALKGGDPKAATDRIEALKTALGSATASPSAAVPEAAALAKTLAELTKKIPAAIAVNPDARAGLVKLATEANANLKGQNLAEAIRCISALERALASATTATDGEADARGNTEATDELRERIKDVQIQAASLPDPAKMDIQGRSRELLAGLGENAPASLAGDVDKLEDALAAAAKSARTAAAAAETGDRVTYRLLQKKWSDAQQLARQQLDQFVKAVLSDPENQAHPSYGDLQSAMNDIASQLPDFGNKIDSVLLSIDDAKDAAARSHARNAAIAILGEYSDALESADGLRELQDVSDDEYGGIAFFSELQSALKSLGAQLEKAA